MCNLLLLHSVVLKRVKSKVLCGRISKDVTQSMGTPSGRKEMLIMEGEKRESSEASFLKIDVCQDADEIKWQCIRKFSAWRQNIVLTGVSPRVFGVHK